MYDFNFKLMKITTILVKISVKNDTIYYESYKDGLRNNLNLLQV